MEGRWTIRPDGPDGRVAHFYADGNEQPVPVVPCDDAAIERAMTAITESYDVITEGDEPEVDGWALKLAERALRAAAEAP